MTSSIVSSLPAAPTAEKVWHPSPLSNVVAFLPLWVLIYSLFAFQTYFEPLGSEYPNILGIEPGVIVDAMAMLWMAIGVVLLWNARSVRIVALVYTVFTIPAIAVVLVSPAVVLIVLNRG
jgi:hypothetical protein